MKKLMVAALLAAVVCSVTGCKTTISDCFRSDLQTRLVPAKFKPTVEVMAHKGVVKGTARQSYWFWFFPHDTPNSFAHELCDGSANPLMIPSVYNAAVYDACEKSGASILLAPRFIETETTGFLWFCGEKTVTVEGVPARITGAKEIPVELWPVLFGEHSGTIRTVSSPLGKEK